MTTSLGAVLWLLAAIAVPLNAAPTLETFVLAVGGRSTDSIAGPPSQVSDFFGSRGVLIPDDLVADGLVGDFRFQSGGSPLTDSLSVVTPNFVTLFSGSNTFTGNASSNANYGKVGAEAHGTYTGWSDGLTRTGSEGFATFRDGMTPFSPTVPVGSHGFTNLHFTIDGSANVVGTGASGIVVRFQQNNGPIDTMLDALVNGSSNPNTFYPYDGPGRAGFAITPFSVSGSGVFETGLLPVTFGTAFDFKLGLLSWLVPGKDVSIDVNFSSSALLTGIDVFDAVGNPVVDFSIESGSGTQYDANGVHIPEPSSLILCLTAALSLIGMSRFSKRATASSRRSKLPGPIAGV